MVGPVGFKRRVPCCHVNRPTGQRPVDTNTTAPPESRAAGVLRPTAPPACVGDGSACRPMRPRCRPSVRTPNRPAAGAIKPAPCRRALFACPPADACNSHSYLLLRIILIEYAARAIVRHVGGHSMQGKTGTTQGAPRGSRHRASALIAAARRRAAADPATHSTPDHGAPGTTAGSRAAAARVGGQAFRMNRMRRVGAAQDTTIGTRDITP